MNHSDLAPDGGLFQSNMWKEFQAFQHKNIFSGEDFFGIVESTPLGNMGYIPRGPKNGKGKVLQALQEIAKEYNLFAIRVEPQTTALAAELKNATKLHFVKAPFDAQPREFLMVSLIPSTEDLLANMKSKWRYNIRLAEKHGISITVGQTQEEREAFVALMQATALRKSIHFHAAEYYKIFTEFFIENKGEFLVAKKDGKVLAGVAVVYYHETAYYVHGGSSDEGRNFMAPHLLQWQALQRAKSRGCTQYDFGGVALKYQPAGKDWAGITRFKTGFAPATESVLLPGTYDIIFSPARYYSYLFLTRLKRFFI